MSEGLRIRAVVRASLLAMVAALAWAGAVHAQTPAAPAAPAAPAGERQALLIPGKQTLQQRVITRPGAILVREPGAAAGEAQLPFSVFYVYGRRPESGTSEWLEVGRSSRGQPDGWIKAEQAIEWYQNLTLAFNNPAQRERVMFFRSRDDVFNLLSGADGAQRARQLRTDALAGRGDGTVVAMEPDAFVDISRRFYLLPILQAERVTLQTGNSAPLLEVASIPLTQDPTPPPRQPQQDQAAMRNFSVGVAFVVDTTLSMDPYIERVRQSIRRVIERIRGNADVGTRFRFALIGYRNSTQAVPQLQYVSRVFANFEDFRDPQRFMSLIQQMEATSVDSGNFDEDAMAGMRSAIDDLKWDDFGGRYIVLVTDAGARRANDPFSTTRLGPAEVSNLARLRGIATYVLHLLTPAGARANDHAQARVQYETLSNWPGVGSLYFPVPDGSLADFGQQVDALTDSLVRQVTEATGAGIQPQQRAAAPAQQRPQPVQTPQQRLTEQTLLVGNAMRLAYLGRLQQSAAPTLLRGWTTDRDLANSDVRSFDVRLLVTRNQLSDLAEVLTVILDQGNQTRLRPADFFNQLRSAAANMTRNPARLRARDAQNLGDLLGEFLSGLPYRSEILELDQDQWLAMGASRQREVLDSMEAKLRLYGEYARRTDIWTSFDNNREPNDAVFPMPLEALP